MSKHVLFIGITGCIGGSVFTAFKHAHPSLVFTALVRNPANNPAIIAAGATPVNGTFSDLELVSRLAAEADIIVNCADADGVEFHGAVLEGMKKRKESGKGVGVLVHTSGSAVFLDGTKEGKCVDGIKVWNDGNVNDIKSITTSMLHGQVDVQILEASSRGEIYSYIICPACVHGLGTGPVGRVSGLAKFLSYLYTSHGGAFIIGEGTNVVGAVHVSDLAALYLLVFNYALSNYPPSDTPYERYYSASSETLTWRRIATAYGKALHTRGKVGRVKVIKGSFDDAGPMGGFLGGNSTSKEERGAALGWTPKGPSYLETLEEDLDILYAEQK